MIVPQFLSALGLVSRAPAACTRASLQSAVDSYLKAVGAGTPAFSTLGTNVSYAENDEKIAVAKGILSQPIKVDFSRSLLDTTTCAAFTEFVATTGHPYVVHTQLHVVDDKISGLESRVSDDGDWLFNATAYLSWTKSEKWDLIPAEKRDSRAVIQAAADTYMDQWANYDLPVPFTVPCARLEGGLYTGDHAPLNNTCKMAKFPAPVKLSNRRYVIDEEYGSVSVFNGFPFIEASKPFEYPSPSSNQIRVEGGGIRYIHEVTICATKGCSQTAPPPPPA